MIQQSINEQFTSYVNGELKRADFEVLIYRFFLHNQDKTCLSHWRHDEYEDFVSWFYSRLHRAIDTYRDTGSSFEAFLGKFLLISSKEYRVRITTQNVTEYSAWSARVPDLYAHEDPPDYSHENEEKSLLKLFTAQNGRKSTRQILALILKCYYYVSDDFMEKITKKTGINCNELREMIDKMQKIRQKKDDEIYRMKERIFSQYYRCMIYEKRLLLVQENSTAHNKLKLRLEKAKTRLERMRKRMTLIRTDATNRQIAQVIGIKKGTVDASLYSLKTKADVLADKSLLN